MKREKEIFDNTHGLFPVRLLGGFICVDFHLGCHGCHFCLNRRDPLLHKILEEQKQLDLKDLGLTPRVLRDFIARSKAFSLARVPIRIGHLTDWWYETTDSEAFLSLMPSDYPGVLLTRFPISMNQHKIIHNNNSFIVHVTITPSAAGIEVSTDIGKLIDSTQGLPLDRVLYMLRPLGKGGEKSAGDVLQMLPRGSHVCFKLLSCNDIPTIGMAKPMEESSLRELKILAQERGLVILEYFGCLFRRLVRRPFFRYRKAASATDSACPNCPNLTLCRQAQEGATRSGFSVIAGEAHDQVMQVAWEIGLEPQSMVADQDGFLLKVDEPTARADEVYLSERLCRDIRFSSVARQDISSVVPFHESIFHRWKTFGLFDTDLMTTWNQRIHEALFKNCGSI